VFAHLVQAPNVNVTKEEYARADRDASTIAHFHEKLLKLSGMMKSASGKELWSP
jgi:hypothetical protein